MKRATVDEVVYRAVKVRDLFRCCRCNAPTMEGAWHHRRGKAVVDAHTDCTCNGIWLCHTCHQWVHGHGLIARLRGWIVSRTSRKHLPFEAPVRTAQHGWVLLDCTGGWKSTDAPDGQ